MNSEVLATQFKKMGHSVILATWTAGQGDRKFSFPVVRNPGLTKLFSLHREAEVVFENNPCLRLAWPSLFYKSASVAALRTWVARNDGAIAWQDKLKMKWLKRADAVIAVSEAVAHCGPSNTKVIGNPFRSDLFRITNKDRNDNTFVFMGRLVSSKGCEIALRSFAMFFDKQKLAGYPLPKFTIIGDGEMREKLVEQAAELGVSEYVTFTGFLQGEELVRELNSCAYLLVPSLIVEAFGNVVLEGMACGCLPIVSDTGGLPDAVGKAGVVVENPNAANFFQAIARIRDNPGREEQLRSEALAHLENHTPKVVAERYLDVISNALEKL